VSRDLPLSALPWHRLPLTELIHENFSVIMTYAFATPALTKWMERFKGEWKYLGKACFEIPRKNVNLALLELATRLRMLDNHEKFPSYWELDFGKVIKQDGTEDKLYFRDMTNKILHSSAIEWCFADQDDPIIICHSDDPARWIKAEIKISSLAVYCGNIMS
jgi:hypothetical protein